MGRNRGSGVGGQFTTEDTEDTEARMCRAEAGAGLPQSKKGRSHRCEVDAQWCEVTLQGCEVNAQRCEVDAQRCEVDAQGCEVTLQGWEVDAQGCEVDAQRCEVDAQGLRRDGSAPLTMTMKAKSMRRGCGEMVRLRSP